MKTEWLFRAAPALGAFAVVFLIAAGPPGGETPQPYSKPASYPRVNTSTWYEVDPAWPERRPDLPWAAVPGVAVDANDQVWIFTRTNPPVQVYTADGKFVRAWGQDIVGGAHHIKIDHDGNVWLADIRLHVVRKCSPEGNVLMTLGTPGEPGCDATHFDKPTDMALAAGGDIFVSDGYGNARVVHFDREGRFVKQWGSLGNGATNFSLPHAIVRDSNDRLYVADRNNARVQVFNRTGQLLDSWRELLVPWGFWITAKDEIWICGSSPTIWGLDPKYPTAPLGCPPKDQMFMRFDTTGKLQQLWTVPKAEDGAERPGMLNWVHGIALDSKGNIYAGDIIGRRVQKFLRKQ